jgi:formylglycine-generating enzyme required for sulfatase activity
MRLSLLAALLFMTTAPLNAQAQPSPLLQESSNGEIFLGPAKPEDRDAWLAAMKQWRTDMRAKLNFDDSLYTAPELAWTQRTFVQPQMMCEERYFYDPVARTYTVDRYLDDLEKRYGGIDSVLIWPVYPNVGIDNRNQHDMLRAMPGGLAGVKRMAADFHRRGVHVLFPMMPWEAGTREEGVSMAEAVARDFKEAGIDGVNGDTMGGVPKEFLDAARAQNHLLAFEPECQMSDIAMVQWDLLSWGYWDKPPSPLVDRYKWLEPRHRTHLSDRWQKNRIFDIQTSFVNGDGYESWESIWGCWNGLTPRAGEALRRVSAIQRALADYLVSPDWEPHFPTLQLDVYASSFPTKDGTLYLLINRSDKDSDGSQLKMAAPAGATFYDLWHGLETGSIAGPSDYANLQFKIEAHGFGAILMLPNGVTPSPKIHSLLAKMKALTQKPLASFDDTWTMLLQQIVPIAPSPKAATAPDGMIAIPAAKFHFKVKGVEIEGNDDYGVDFQYPWEQRPWRAHEHDIDIPAFYIDKFPVTNEQFKAFLDATNYRPADDYNFLKDWTCEPVIEKRRVGDHGPRPTYPPGWGKKPVTWVSLEDARAYATWAGKRLPHEWEWQYAAQGTDGRLYPWGAQPDPTAFPAPVKGHDLPGPDDVDAHPKGASPFGVMDLVGNVWQWTDEYQDDHTRAAVVRGDSYYQPQGSGWYFPRNPTLDVHGKYLLMCPGKDRSGTLGFRCVKDR